MKPMGNRVSVLTLLSTVMRRWAAMRNTSRRVRAYLRRFLKRMIMGMHSRVLWGPGEGLGAQTPVSLSNIQWLGALSLLRCFFGPLVINTFVVLDEDKKKGKPH